MTVARWPPSTPRVTVINPKPTVDQTSRYYCILQAFTALSIITVPLPVTRFGNRNKNAKATPISRYRDPAVITESRDLFMVGGGRGYDPP